MAEDQLTADVDRYAQAMARNVAPSAIGSDPLIGGDSPIEQLLRVLGLAANSGDAQDNADSAEGHATRDAIVGDAAAAFAAQDTDAASSLAARDPSSAAARDPSSAGARDPSSAGAQQLPQMVGGIATAVTGALAGILQPISQLPQQIGQVAQQGLQTALGAAGQSPVAENPDSGADPFADEMLSDGEDPSADTGLGDVPGLSGSSSAGPGGLFGATMPSAPLAAPITPSAATSPASASPAATTPAPVPGHLPGAGAGMAGMPMVPPAAMSGAGTGDRETKADTKRVSPPPVRNGAPVQGRVSVMPPVTTRIEGKPITARRILLTPNATRGDA